MAFGCLCNFVNRYLPSLFLKNNTEVCNQQYFGFSFLNTLGICRHCTNFWLSFGTSLATTILSSGHTWKISCSSPTSLPFHGEPEIKFYGSSSCSYQSSRRQVPDMFRTRVLAGQNLPFMGCALAVELDNDSLHR